MLDIVTFRATNECWNKLPTTFFVKDGIVVIVKGGAEAYGLDITSISYENRG